MGMLKRYGSMLRWCNTYAQDALEQCKALRSSEEAKQHVALYACAQRALVLVSSKVGAPTPYQHVRCLSHIIGSWRLLDLPG